MMKWIKTSLMVVILLVLICGGSFVKAVDMEQEFTCYEYFKGYEDFGATWHNVSIEVDLGSSCGVGYASISINYSKKDFVPLTTKVTFISGSEILKLTSLLKEGLECCKTAKEGSLKIEKTLGSIVDKFNNKSLAVAFESTRKAKKVNVILKFKGRDYYLYEAEVGKLVQFLEKFEELVAEEKRQYVKEVNEREKRREEAARAYEEARAREKEELEKRKNDIPLNLVECAKTYRKLKIKKELLEYELKYKTPSYEMQKKIQQYKNFCEAEYNPIRRQFFSLARDYAEIHDLFKLRDFAIENDFLDLLE